MVRPKQEGSSLRGLVDLASMGIHLVVSTFVGGGIGYYLDRRVFDTFPWLSLIFLLLGIAAGFKKIVDLARRSAEEEGGNDAPPGD